jgi:T5orf172 domain
MPIPFEPTRSYAYKATRYELLPRIVEKARDFGDVPFRLLDVWKPLLTETYTPEQLEISVPKQQSAGSDTMRAIFGWYIHYLASELKFFEGLGKGMFRNIPLEEEVADADAVATDDETNDGGIIYAYTFPSIRKPGKFPIKVGLTTTGDAEARVTHQCRAACCFERPVILRTWEVVRVAAVEDAIHSTLEARGSKRDAPGNEWFDTTLDEVEAIVNFVRQA